MSTYTQAQTRPPPAPLKRSSSFFGAIKDIVTAPLSWFGGGEDDFGNSDDKGKRRRLPTPPVQMNEENSGQRVKRMRVTSPHTDNQPYLDPPRSAFNQVHKTTIGARTSNHRHTSPSPRKTLRVPTTTPRSRRTMSPYLSGSQSKAQPVARTMSLDPPSALGYSGASARLHRAPTMQDLTEEGDAMSISREPSTSHLRMRTSVTPQPSGSDFGPVVPPRKERDNTEPPPLTVLMSNPMFVKPPPGLQKSGAMDVSRQATLGSLLDSQRGSTRSPVRRGSALFGTGSMTDVSVPAQSWPVNAAEKVLHELEVYKTPLLPSRLKGAPIPEMFLPKKNRPIVLMHDRERERKKGKGKNKIKDRDGVNGTKPYAGEGGMKKWLARRIREEDAVRVSDEANRKKEKEQAMDEDEDAEAEAERLREQRKKEQAEEAKQQKELEVPPILKAPAFEPRPTAMREVSSLRVGRTRVRNHIERPISRRTTKFSAAFEDDEDAMDDDKAALEEAAKKVPLFEIPAGFTFAKEAPIPHDVTNAKEPPISALPFSLSKPSGSATKLASELAPEPIAPAAPAAPTISLAPPTPQPPKSETLTSAAAATTTSGIPNFFATTPAFNKPLSVAIDSGSFGVPPTSTPKPIPAPVPVSDTPKVPEVSSSLFGTPANVSHATSVPSVTPATNSKFGLAAHPANTSIFSTSATTTAVSFGAPATPKEVPAPVKGTPIPAPALPAVTPLPTASSSFGAPPPAAETPKAAEPEASESILGAATPSHAPFSFGAPAAPPPTAEPPKPAFSFGQSLPAPAAAVSSKSAFSFGQSAPSVSPAPAPVTETPKPLFGTQGSSTTPSFSLGARSNTTEEKPVSSPAPFSFGAPTPPVSTEKKPFTFGPPSAAPSTAVKPSFGFGPTTAGSNAADTSRPFSFGQPTSSLAPVRPVTPPKVDQEISMDESPSREMNPSEKAPERPTLDFSFNSAGGTPAGSTLFAQSPATTTGPGFGFGTASVNPFGKPEDKDKFGSSFGQSSGTSFAFGQKAPETSVPVSAAPFSFAQATSPNVAPSSPFTFGQAASNPFGQQSTSSAPSSPSTFNRPAQSFAFGATAPTQPPAPSFAFGGSQPASPAAPTGGLPQPTGSPFTFGQQSGSTPAAAPNPFAPAAAPPAGGTLFTIGAAPQADGRQIKKLPRRGVGRR